MQQEFTLNSSSTSLKRAFGWNCYSKAEVTFSIETRSWPSVCSATVCCFTYTARVAFPLHPQHAGRFPCLYLHMSAYINTTPSLRPWWRVFSAWSRFLFSHEEPKRRTGNNESTPLLNPERHMRGALICFSLQVSVWVENCAGNMTRRQKLWRRRGL